MEYVPHSIRQEKEMLSCLGLEGKNQLFESIPESIRLDSGLAIGGGCTEIELKRHLKTITGSDKPSLSFLGAGRYPHWIPSLVQTITSRPEFYTSYTPYQAEASQGMLQALFEYQSFMTELTGMEVSNAGMYDGATALAESVLMALRNTEKSTIVCPKTVNPFTRQVLETYGKGCGFQIKYIETHTPLTKDEAEENIDGDTAAFILQNPNFFGSLEDYGVLDVFKGRDVFSIVYILEATSLGILEPPRQADIVCGDAQALGNPVSYGGPSVGFICTGMDYVRSMPGRVVGETTDDEGEKGYVLTYQTREQHIRRGEATSNICTAESLNALATAVYLSVLGPEGLMEVAGETHRNAVYLAEELRDEAGIELVFEQPFYNELLVKSENPVKGLDVSPYYPSLKGARLYSVTEKHTKKQMDGLVRELGGEKN